MLADRVFRKVHYGVLGMTRQQFKRFLQSGRCHVSKKTAILITVADNYDRKNPYFKTLLKIAEARSR